MFRNQFTEDRFVAAVEKFVDAFTTMVNRQAQPPAPVRTFDEVRNYLRNGQKIEAIKLIRQMTGAGLKDAKDMADAIQNTLY